MTTLAIIGGGIAGRSLLYHLTTLPFSYEKVLLFDSDIFAPACSLRSTAIVARRGVTRGHSELGDLLYEAFDTFKEHVMKDAPKGVVPIIQYTGAITKVELTRKRYPDGAMSKHFGKEMYLAQEDGFLVEPRTYLDWLLEKGKVTLPLECVDEFVTKVEGSSIVTQSGKEFFADKIIFCAGAGSRFWKPKVAKVVQGAYLEFNSVAWDAPSFALTLDGDNLIYHRNRLLIGSSTLEADHLLASMEDLYSIYQRLSVNVSMKLPPFELGDLRVGQREKAKKRAPYLIQDGAHTFIGGLYKNGFTLGLQMARNVARQHLLLA